ncbi:hypothetical protein [Mycobacterium sp. E787]|nr:hypothetical protein [Mycobacterium sp. E787]
MATKTSGPDEESARVMLIDHFAPQVDPVAGGRDWLVTKDHDGLYR